jgi:hypothetical protein
VLPISGLSTISGFGSSLIDDAQVRGGLLAEVREVGGVS